MRDSTARPPPADMRGSVITSGTASNASNYQMPSVPTSAPSMIMAGSASSSSKQPLFQAGLAGSSSIDPQQDADSAIADPEPSWLPPQRLSLYHAPNIDRRMMRHLTAASLESKSSGNRLASASTEKSAEQPRASNVSGAPAQMSPLRAACASSDNNNSATRASPTVSNGRSRRPIVTRPSINACVINDKRTTDSSHITSSIISDGVFAVCISRFIILLESLPLSNALSIPRLALVTFALCLTYHQLHIDVDGFVAKDDLVSRGVGRLVRLVCIWGATWAGMTAFVTLGGGMKTFVGYMIGTRVLCVMIWGMVSLCDNRCRAWTVLRIAGCSFVSAIWAFSLCFTPQFDGYIEAIWLLAVAMECGFLGLEARVWQRRGLFTWGGVPVFSDWSTQVSKRHERVFALAVVVGGLAAMFPLRRGVGEVDATLIPHDAGPFSLTVVAFMILYSLVRCNHIISALPNLSAQLHDPPLSTTWRLNQIPLMVSMIIALTGLKSTVQGLYDGFNGISNFSPVYPPNIDINPNSTLESLLAMFVNGTGYNASNGFYYSGGDDNNTPQFYWDQKRGETLLSLGLAACILFSATSSILRNISSHGIARSSRETKSKGWSSSHTRNEGNSPLHFESAILKSAEIANEVDEFWRDVWPLTGAVVACGDSSSRAVTKPNTSDASTTAKKKSPVERSAMRWDVLSPIRGRAWLRSSSTSSTAMLTDTKHRQKGKDAACDEDHEDDNRDRTFCYEINLENAVTDASAYDLNDMDAPGTHLSLTNVLLRPSLVRLLLIVFLIGAVPSATLLVRVLGIASNSPFTMLGGGGGEGGTAGPNGGGNSVGLVTMILCAFAMILWMVAEEIRCIQQCLFG